MFSGWFHLQTVFMDMQLDKLKQQLHTIVLNMFVAREYVAEVVQKIRVIKEHCHLHYSQRL